MLVPPPQSGNTWSMSPAAQMLPGDQITFYYKISFAKVGTYQMTFNLFETGSSDLLLATTQPPISIDVITTIIPVTGGGIFLPMVSR